MTAHSDDNSDLLPAVVVRLDILIKIQTINCTLGKTQKETVSMLHSAGLNASSISLATGLPTTTVSPILSRLRRQSVD